MVCIYFASDSLSASYSIIMNLSTVVVNNTVNKQNYIFIHSIYFLDISYISYERENVKRKGSRK